MEYQGKNENQSKPTKLSDAIELGGQGLEEACNTFFEWGTDEDGNDTLIAACPMGCAYIALLGRPESYREKTDSLWIEPVERALGLDGTLVLDPRPAGWSALSEHQVSPGVAVVHAADRARWSRSEVVAWLRERGL